MKSLSFVVAVAAVLPLMLGSVLLAQEGKPAAETNPAVAGPEVTLTGVMMSNWACTRGLKEKDHRAVEQEVPVFFALDGTPEVAAAFQDIFKELIAGHSIDYEQAERIEDEMNKRLKYWITPCELTSAKENGVSGNNGGMFRLITGTVSEKDGKKWITPSRIMSKLDNGRPVSFKYPDGFYAPDKPFKKPGEKPLVLKVTDKLSLKCILLPRGEFMMKVPFYALQRWCDEFPLHITLTKPFWMAEIPVTQEMWDAVMGAENNFSTLKDPQRPVRNLWCKDINKFCQILSEKNGRKVRLPGEAEWEWACRVGTSNPPFIQKYKAQNSRGKARGEHLPVKSKESNAWGLYDMVGAGFEVTRDKGDLHLLHRYEDKVDPYNSCEADEAAGRKHYHWAKCPGAMVTYHETVATLNDRTDHVPDNHYGSTRFRVVVDATPEEIAEMEKAEKE